MPSRGRGRRSGGAASPWRLAAGDAEGERGFLAGCRVAAARGRPRPPCPCPQSSRRPQAHPRKSAIGLAKKKNMACWEAQAAEGAGLACGRCPPRPVRAPPPPRRYWARPSAGPCPPARPLLPARTARGVRPPPAGRRARRAPASRPARAPADTASRFLGRLPSDDGLPPQVPATRPVSMRPPRPYSCGAKVTLIS